MKNKKIRKKESSYFLVLYSDTLACQIKMNPESRHDGNTGHRAATICIGDDGKGRMINKTTMLREVIV